MYLETINSPADVKKLSMEQLPVLAEEMRQALLLARQQTRRPLWP